MAKMRKRGKSAASAQPTEDPRAMFGAPQPPRQPMRPASSTPLADFLSRRLPGVDDGYVVIPRSLAEGMSLPWQQQLANLLGQFYSTHSQLSWPVYKVVPSRRERLIDLDEGQLAEAGYMVEIDAEGDMVYRERSGRKVENPQDTMVLVSCLDPIPPRESGMRRLPPVAGQPPARRQAPPQSGAGPQPAAPAPMNVGPQPVWRATPQQVPPRGQPQPPPITPPGGYQQQPAPQPPYNAPPR